MLHNVIDALGYVLTVRRSITDRSPHRSKITYTLIAIFFCGTMCYVIFAAAWLTTKSVRQTLVILRSQNAEVSTRAALSAVLSNEVFRALVVATAGTYILQFLASLLSFDYLH